MRSQAMILLIRQHAEQLISMKEPKDAGQWKPTEEDRRVYVQLLEKILIDLEKLDSYRNELAVEKRFEDSVSSADQSYLEDEVLSRRVEFEIALRRLDSDSADRLEKWKDGKRLSLEKEQLRETFEHSLGNMLVLLEEEPEYRRWYRPGIAIELIDKPLVEFDPDGWWRRSEDVKAIPIDPGQVLPKDVKNYLVEAYRSYIFGNFLAVMAIARAIYEQGIVDFAVRNNVQLNEVNSRNNKSERKSLFCLINEVMPLLPPNTVNYKWNDLRDSGNRILHGVNPEAQDYKFQRRKADKEFKGREERAKKSIGYLGEVLAKLYT